MSLSENLGQKARWVRRETLKLHKLARESRIASCLSDIEIFTVLYYGKILRYDPKNLLWPDRDRFVVSKGHGAVSIYPILADLGFFDKEQLAKIGTAESFLGVIPDTSVPGFETINGSLGHGLGVACGMALALKKRKADNRVFVVCGDGELNEGAVWEAVMFAGYHGLGNLILIIDNNKISMLGFQKDILGLDPVEGKFEAFGWSARRANGHDVQQLYNALLDLKNDRSRRPKVLVADTVKGNGVKDLENQPLSHVMSLSTEQIDAIVGTTQ